MTACTPRLHLLGDGMHAVLTPAIYCVSFATTTVPSVEPSQPQGQPLLSRIICNDHPANTA
jgi:hypothetical protein